MIKHLDAVLFFFSTVGISKANRIINFHEVKSIGLNSKEIKKL